METWRLRKSSISYSPKEQLCLEMGGFELLMMRAMGSSPSQGLGHLDSVFHDSVGKKLGLFSQGQSW